MTDTPRTDAATVSSEYVRREMDIYSHKFVLADYACELERELAEKMRLLAEARDDVSELLERMKTEGWHRDDRIEWHVALLSRIDAHLASGGWIDCKDRLPEEGQSVLIEWKGGIHKTCRADGEWLLPANSPSVTIWQPLPSLPKETK